MILLISELKTYIWIQKLSN